MEPHLKFESETLVPFDDDTYRWVCAKRFGIAGHGAPVDFVAALIRHPEYSADYPDRPGFPPRHGPYDARAITPESFAEIPADKLAELLQSLYELHDLPPTPAVLERITVAVAPMKASRCYQLRNLSDAVIMSGAFLDFQEVVGVDQEARCVYLLVLAADV